MPFIMTMGVAEALLAPDDGTVPLGTAGLMDPKPNAMMTSGAAGTV
jgi:hypothetical protein